MGIWMSMGTQPLAGLMPYFWYSFIISMFTFWGSSGYFSLSLAISG